MRACSSSLRFFVLLAVLAAAAASAGVSWRGTTQAGAQPSMRFESVAVFVDSSDVALAAYQVEVRAVGGKAKLVGIEGGEHAAYAEPPHYDPRALHDGQVNERIVIAAIGEGELPTGRTLVARLQIAVQGETEYWVTLEAAGDGDGTRIDAKAEVFRDER